MGATTVAEAGRNHRLPGKGLWLWLSTGLVVSLIVALYFRVLPDMAKD